MSSSKKLIIGGNWKSNGSLKSVDLLINTVLNMSEFNQDNVEVVVAPIGLHLL